MRCVRPGLLLAAALAACTKPAPPAEPDASATPSVGYLAVARGAPVVEERLPSLVRACQGQHVDLRWVGSDVGTCWEGAASTDWPSGVEAKLVPSAITLEAGGVGFVDYGVFNGSSQATEIDLPNVGCFESMQLGIYDGAGERVSKDCTGGGGCGSPPARITLPPGADARLRLQVRARASKPARDEDTCTVETAPLPPGEYVLRPTMYIADASPQVRLTVTPSTGTVCADAEGCINAPAIIRDGPSDPRLVLQTYGHACALGEGFGCRLLGDQLRGEAAERSYHRAAGLLELACDAGQPGDCYQLGFLFEQGIGVAADHEAAKSAHLRAYEGFLRQCAREEGVKGCTVAARIAGESVLDDAGLAKAARALAERDR